MAVFAPMPSASVMTMTVVSPGVFAEAAPGVAEIEQQRIEPGPDASVADVLFDLDDAAGTAERGDRRAPAACGLMPSAT